MSKVKYKIIAISLLPIFVVIAYLISNTGTSSCIYLNDNNCGKNLGLSQNNLKASSLFDIYKNELGESKKVDARIYTNIYKKDDFLYKIPNSELLTTGDVVFDALLLESKKYFTDKDQSEKTIKIIATNESSARLSKYYKPINYILNDMFGKDIELPINLFVTDSKDVDLTLLRKIASDNKCEIPEFGYQREKGTFYGANVFSNSCGDRASIVLDLWQYKYSFPEDPQMLMQTVSDELMTVWQQLNAKDYEKNSKSYGWFYQGSQQLPFLLFMINEQGLSLDFNKKCSAVSLNELLKNEYEGGKLVSCDHALGLVATKLIVANIGIEKFLAFFQDKSEQSFEGKFESNFGISLDRFTVKFDTYLELLKANKKIDSVENYKIIVNKLRF